MFEDITNHLGEHDEKLTLGTEDLELKAQNIGNYLKFFTETLKIKPVDDRFPKTVQSKIEKIRFILQNNIELIDFIKALIAQANDPEFNSIPDFDFFFKQDGYGKLRSSFLNT